MATNEKQINVAVVGGGFAGMALAIGLQKYAHLNVHVYEAAHKFAEIGAGVVISPNAQYAMDLIDPRMREGYNRRAAFTAKEPDENGLSPWMSIFKGQEPDMMQPVYTAKHPMRGSTIHRAHFLDELVKLIKPNTSHFGKRVDRIYETEDPESPVVLHFRDGTTVEADVVFGCDGIHSPTRKHILGTDDPATTATFVGASVIRAIVPIEQAEKALGTDIHKGGEVYCGKNGSLIAFPLADNTLYNITASRFSTGPWPHEEWIVDADVSKVREFFKDWHPWVQKNINLLPEKGTQEWSIWDMPPARTFCKGRVAILGDAAHATSPFQGSGAGQAIEDACVLSHLFGKLLDPAQPRKFPPTPAKTIPVLLQTYDAVRRFRSQKVCFTSREMFRIVTGNDLGVGMHAAEIREALGDRLGWIYEHDQKQQVKDAFLLFEQLRSAAERASQQHPA